MSYTSTIKYKGNVITTLQENEDVELDCAGTVMDGDIEVSVEYHFPSFNESAHVSKTFCISSLFPNLSSP